MWTLDYLLWCSCIPKPGQAGCSVTDCFKKAVLHYLFHRAVNYQAKHFQLIWIKFKSLELLSLSDHEVFIISSPTSVPWWLSNSLVRITPKINFSSLSRTSTQSLCCFLGLYIWIYEAFQVFSEYSDTTHPFQLFISRWNNLSSLNLAYSKHLVILQIKPRLRFCNKSTFPAHATNLKHYDCVKNYEKISSLFTLFTFAFPLFMLLLIIIQCFRLSSFPH